jgi:hypothetical protein
MSSKDYTISPPPEDEGREPLFRVVYTIDVNAADQKKAAQTAWQMMRAEDAFEPILVTMDSEGNTVKFDLNDHIQVEGDSIEASAHQCQPHNIATISSNEIIDQLEEVLAGIDVGGEQSRQFADEIKVLNRLRINLVNVKNTNT